MTIFPSQFCFWKNYSGSLVTCKYALSDPDIQPLNLELRQSKFSSGVKHTQGLGQEKYYSQAPSCCFMDFNPGPIYRLRNCF